MASKRDLKKAIKYSISEVAGECLFTEWAYDNVNAVKVSEIILKLANLQDDAVMKVSVSYEKVAKDFDGTMKEFNQAKGKYFKQCYGTLQRQFNEGLAAVVKDLNALIPEAQREVNKQIVK